MVAIATLAVVISRNINRIYTIYIHTIIEVEQVVEFVVIAPVTVKK